MQVTKESSEKAKVVRRKAGRTLPNLRGNTNIESPRKPVAIVCADIHLCDKPPIARSCEPDWFAAMARPLNELNNLAVEYNVPVICAGDIFDKWNCSPELINFALQYLPTGMLAIPGQHELPHHRLQDLRKSAFWTLVKADKIEMIPEWVRLQRLHLYGFPWGTPLKPNTIEPKLGEIHVAVVHKYLWYANHGYPGVDENSNARNLYNQGEYDGYHFAVYGDNHRHFSAGFKNCTVYNCGCLIPRKADEKDQPPTAGILYDDGCARFKLFDDSQDLWLSEEDLTKSLSGVIDLGDLSQAFKSLATDEVDFVDLLKQLLNETKIGKRVKRVIRELLEETND